MFGDAIDYDKVRIANKRVNLLQPENGGLCTMNTINIAGEGYCDDYSLAEPGLTAFFVHEMTHIWQYQSNALSLATKFISESLRYRGKYFEKAYKYDLSDKDKFTSFGIEQQACMMEDWYILKNHPEFDEYYGRCKNDGLSPQDRMKKYKALTEKHFKPHAPEKRPVLNKAPKFS